MRRFAALCAALLLSSIAAGAQGNSSAPGTPAAEPSFPAGISDAPSPSEYPWQVGVSFGYIRFDLAGATFHTQGLNSSLTRFVNDWVGLEADVDAGWGTVTFPGASVDTKFLFYGGGPRIAFRHAPRLQPWGHALFGGGHFSGGPLGRSNAISYKVGGGVDVAIGPRLFWRSQANYLATRFVSTTQNNLQFATGLVFSF